MRLHISSPGPLTTVQDLGRWGYQAMGMPVSGAMDPSSLRRGNAMLGNRPGDAALEMACVGPDVTFEGSGAVVLTGAELSAQLNSKPVENWAVFEVKSGDRLRFGQLRRGVWGYLCVTGGVSVPLVLGSRSTYLKTGTGGHGGRALAAGDVLQTGEPSAAWRRRVGFICPDSLKPDWSDRALGLVLGLQQDAFPPAGLATLFESEYRVDLTSDRMGYRLEGPAVEHALPPDIVSDGVPLGSVQIPGSGEPIVMMADRQTTGGYTKVGVLTAVSTAFLAQHPTGSSVRFRRLSQDEGVEEARREAEVLAELARAVARWFARPDEKLKTTLGGTWGPVGQRWNLAWRLEGRLEGGRANERG